MDMAFMGRFFRLVALLLTVLAVISSHALAQTPREVKDKISAQVLDRMTFWQPQDLLVMLDDLPTRKEVIDLQSQRSLSSSDQEMLEFKATRFAEMKRSIFSALSAEEVEILRPYNHLPLAFLRVRSRHALDKLLANSDVIGVYVNGTKRHMLAQSLPQIGQPQVAAQGHEGAGTTVAVLDTGVNYTLPAFGSCSAPGVPADCKVVFAQDFAPDDGRLDDDGHGTNVAAIVLGVAPSTRIAALDVFGVSGFARDSDILAAVDWAIANRATFNIVAINLSLGGEQHFAPVTSGVYKAAADSLRSAGILAVAASGNDGYTNAMSIPAAIDGVVSVGAVYDAAIGPVNWSSCADSTTAVDKVICFTNSASFLTLLAPGARITAAGSTLGGTSQAAPHVAGAVAILRASFPSETLEQTIARLTSGVPVNDSRNGVIKPRLSLPAAIGVSVPCGYAISPTNRTHGGTSDAGSIAVTAASSSCGWTAQSNAEWIRITSGFNGQGNGSVTYAVVANPNISSRTGTLTVAGLIFTVVQGGTGIFPPGNVLPLGWTTPASARAAWQVASDAAFEGAFSLKSGAIGNTQKTQIEVSDTFPAGAVSFARKVSSEQGFDFLRFFIDGILQEQWSGEQDWTIVSFPLTAGTHTLRWSYEKDSSVARGADAAWIDSVSLPAATNVDVHTYVPSASAPTGFVSYVRVINTGSTATPINVSEINAATGTIGFTGQLVSALPAGAALTFTAQQIETALGRFFPPGERPRIRVSGNTSLEVQSFLLQPGGVINEISGALAGASIATIRFYVPAAAAPTGYASYLRVINTGTNASSVTVTRIDPTTGQRGGARLLIPTLPAGAALILNARQIEEALGSPVQASERPQLQVSATNATLAVQSFLQQPNGVFSEISSGQSGTTIDTRIYVPSTAVGYTSYIRIINGSGIATPVTVVLLDDVSGEAIATGTLIASLPAFASMTFTSAQIETALRAAIPSTSRPRIRIVASTNIEVQSYLLQPGGSITEISGASTGSAITARFFVPAAAAQSGYTSYLRVINTGATPTPITVTLIDDVTGNPGATGTITTALAAGAAQTFNSGQIEAALGISVPAAARPRIRVSGVTQLEVQSYLSQPDGTFIEISSSQSGP